MAVLASDTAMSGVVLASVVVEVNVWSIPGKSCLLAFLANFSGGGSNSVSKQRRAEGEHEQHVWKRFHWEVLVSLSF